MLEILLDGVVAEEGEARVVSVPAADLLVQRGQELLDGRAAVEADHLVGAVEEVDGYGVGQRVVVRVLQEDREDLHARGLDLAAAVLQGALQGSLAVRPVLAALRSIGDGFPVIFTGSSGTSGRRYGDVRGTDCLNVCVIVKIGGLTPFFFFSFFFSDCMCPSSGVSPGFTTYMCIELVYLLPVLD